jgi:hypothetical protein
MSNNFLISIIQIIIILIDNYYTIIINNWQLLRNFLKKKDLKISREAVSDNAPKSSIKNTLAGSQSVPLKRRSIEAEMTQSPSRKLSKLSVNETKDPTFKTGKLLLFILISTN